VKRLRVLHVVGSLDVGGAQKLTALVATGLDPQRFDVAVLNLGPIGLHSNELRGRGIRVIDLGLPIRPRPTDIPRIVGAIWGLSRIFFSRPRWDIVHTHLFRTSVLCAIPARLSGSRLFGTVHRNYYRWQPIVERVLAPLHEAIVVDSAAVGRILQTTSHIPEAKYVVIHNGIDLTEFESPPTRAQARVTLGIADDDIVITEIAHLEPHKGQQVLISAFDQLSDDRVRLLLVGDGSARLGLERQVADLRLTDRVTFTGARADLPALLAASDILALPSTYEGFGIVQAEAMYFQLPVVASDRGGSTEVVQEGITGFLVPYGDVAALADRLDQLIASPELRGRFGEAGRARVLERFTQQAMAARYAALYEGTIGRGLGDDQETR
jgi:glycosyltransferase involved in cell wall biosynthesis